MGNAQTEGARLAQLHPETVVMPEAAQTMIKNHVINPALVECMVTIDHGLTIWLQ